MPHEIEVKARALDKNGMTFADLREFVQRAMKNDVEDTAAVSAQVFIGGKLKQITVTGGGA